MAHVLRTLSFISFLSLTHCSSLGLKAPWAADTRGPSSASTSHSMDSTLSTSSPARLKPAGSDVHLGMSGDQAANLWGTPVQREMAAGKNPRYQRWTFEKTVITAQGARTQTRYLYLEDNRVIGWETR